MKKVFLETDEYDIFMFPVPKDVLKGKKFLCTVFPRKSVKQWVVSWMEKLHPCLDGRFLSDIRFYREKRQIMALVTVAEKIRIAHHLVKKRTSVYVQRPYKRRVFASKTPVCKLLAVPALSFIMGFTALSGFSAGDCFVSSGTDVDGACYSLYADFSSGSNDECFEPVLLVETVIQNENAILESVSDDCEPDDVEAHDADYKDDLSVEQNMPERVEPPEISLSGQTIIESETSLEIHPFEQYSADDSISFPILPDVTEIPEIPEKQEFPKCTETLEQFDTESFLLFCSDAEILDSKRFADISENTGNLVFPEELAEAPDTTGLSPPLQKKLVPELTEPPSLDDFISLVSSVGGHVSNFIWRTSPVASAVIAIKGCFPEDVYSCVEKLCEDAFGEEISFDVMEFAENAVFPLLSFSSISYINNVPSFLLTVDYSGFVLPHVDDISDSQTGIWAGSQKNNDIGSQKFSLQKKNHEPVQAVFRRLIAETGGVISSESMTPPSVSGSIPDELWLAFSEKVGEYYARDVSCGISNVSFDVSGTESVFISAEFDDEKPLFFPLDNISVLFSRNEEEEIFPVQEHIAQNNVRTVPDAEEIGCMYMENGMYVSFFRSSDGKIIRGDPYEK